MLKGIHLTLMIGPSLPVPAPQPVIEALQSVQVNSARERSGFQLTFTVGKTSLLQMVLLPAGVQVDIHRKYLNVGHCTQFRNLDFVALH
ncbi:MAG: hypothetical protein ACREYF_29155 [Gammaproteobacteria bacterium]